MHLLTLTLKTGTIIQSQRSYAICQHYQNNNNECLIMTKVYVQWISLMKAFQRPHKCENERQLVNSFERHMHNNWQWDTHTMLRFWHYNKSKPQKCHYSIHPQLHSMSNEHARQSAVSCVMLKLNYWLNSAEKQLQGLLTTQYAIHTIIVIVYTT